MIILTIGCLLFAYTTFIRPFTTDTQINDKRMDNLYWWIGSFFLILLGLFTGV